MKAIELILRDFSPRCTRAGFLRWFLNAHPPAKFYLNKDGPTARFLDEAKSNEAARITNILGDTSQAPTLKDVEGAFERLVDSARRRKQGAFYTPDHIIDFLISEGLNGTASPHPQLLDPACGSGGFLARGAVHFSKQLGIPFAKALTEHVAGVDIDHDAIDHARCLLELHAAIRYERIKATELRLVCMDTLLSPPSELLDAVGAQGGVQVLATNPPYVKLQTLSAEYRRQLAHRYPNVSRFNFSLALLFLVAGRELLSSDGTLAYITQNNLFTSLAGESVRHLLQEAQCVRRIIDFGHHRVFKGVLAYTCLVFLDRKRHTAIEFERIERDVNLDALRALEFSAVPVDSLKPKKWRLAKPQHLKNLKRIETSGEPLGTIANIKVGFATLKDKVFFVSGPLGSCIAVHPETGQKYEIELEITREAVCVADVRDERQLLAATRRIIFPYRPRGGKYELIAEGVLRTDFPLTFKYLNECRTLLESRDKGRRSYEAWYAWGRTQGREAPGPKLLTKTFNTCPQFFYDKSDRLFCNGYSVSMAESSLFRPAIRLDALQVILQSRIMHYYAKLTSFQIDGNFQCYQKNFIERFGIPLLSNTQQQELVEVDSEEAHRMLARAYGVALKDLDEVVGPIDYGKDQSAISSKGVVN